ncbi:MAG: IS3 family transposase [Nitrosomonas sp.]|nr:IS3 family transposase [Nitrosomonas sp.]
MRLELDIQRVWKGNFRVYGVRKVWRQLLREGIGVACCTVERLMKKLGLQGVRRGRKCWITVADDSLYRATDKVNRQFTTARPNQLWVAGQPVIAHRFSTGCIGTGTVGTAENRGKFIIAITVANICAIRNAFGNIPPAEFEMAYIAN